MSAEHNIVDGVEGDNALDAQSNQPYIVARTTVANARTRVRNNSWGPFTYADLIESAIQSSPQRALKLSKIYSWFATNIPYFSERTTAQASKQWKVSVESHRAQISIILEFNKAQSFWSRYVQKNSE
ncbi:hypothetical protein ACOME3_003418 [Neoechinorhynchus agilis]